MGYLNPTSDFRWIIPTETDANSPLSEELMSQIRENLEAGNMGIINTGRRAVVTDNGGGSDTMTVEKGTPFADYPDWIAGEFVGIILDITSGIAIGSRYTITGNTAMVGAGAGTVTAAGDAGAIPPIPPADFNADGIAIGDEIMISYIFDYMAHTHDGINSAPLAVKSMAAAAGYDELDSGRRSIGNVYKQMYPRNQINSKYKLTFQYLNGMRFLHYDFAMYADQSNDTTVNAYTKLKFPTQTVPLPDGSGNYQTLTADIESDAVLYRINQTSDLYNMVWVSDESNQLDITGLNLINGVIYQLQIIMRGNNSNWEISGQNSPAAVISTRVYTS